MIEHDGGGPSGFLVAGAAILGHLAHVGVAEAVATLASGAYRFADTPFMTGRALQFRMPEVQVESEARVGKEPVGPVCRGVAGLANRAVISLVGILTGMAVSTSAGKSVPVVRAVVAIHAIESLVPFRERESGFAEVIEADSLPARIVMTGTASGALRATMHVIHCMTAYAVRRGTCEDIATVAIHTGNLCVAAGQRKCKQRMIEACFLPVVRDVAVLAFLAQGSAMHVVSRVAAAAWKRGVPAFRIGRVTICTGKPEMLAKQRKVGLAMVK